MENKHQDDFSLEPMVIIHDSNEEQDDNPSQESDPLSIDEDRDDLIKSIGPEISIIPIKKTTKPRPQIKIRLFEKEYSPTKDDKKVKSITRPPREVVNKVSLEEALKAGDTYPHRKSSPLEKCPICKKYFRRMRTHLMKHESEIRSPTDPLTCTHCKKVFTSFTHLETHMKSHAIENRPYICDVCHKSFTQSCNLVNHMRVHTGEKPFKCPHCDRAFTQSGNLNNHIRLHTDEKPFKCHFCEKAFVQSGNLNSHIRNNHKFMDDVFNMHKLEDQNMEGIPEHLRNIPEHLQ